MRRQFNVKENFVRDAYLFKANREISLSMTDNNKRQETEKADNTVVSNCFFHFEELSVPTLSGISCIDITPRVRDIIARTGYKEGVVTVISKHSTVSILINEFEPRFVDDLRQYMLKVAPPSYPYLHNDLDFRTGPPDWPGGDAAWRQFRATQPPNAHSHIIASLLGTSESIPLHKGLLKIGAYQNIIVVEADGPKTRSIGVQITGSK